MAAAGGGGSGRGSSGPAALPLPARCSPPPGPPLPAASRPLTAPAARRPRRRTARSPAGEAVSAPGEGAAGGFCSGGLNVSEGRYRCCLGLLLLCSSGVRKPVQEPHEVVGRSCCWRQTRTAVHTCAERREVTRVEGLPQHLRCPEQLRRCRVRGWHRAPGPLRSAPGAAPALSLVQQPERSPGLRD